MPHKVRSVQLEAQRQWYRDHKDRWAGQNSARRHQKRILVLHLKTGRTCLDCRIEKRPRVLEFHHRLGEIKVATISQMVRRKFSDEAILAEAAKCDLICSNCHAERHNDALTCRDGGPRLHCGLKADQ